MKQPPDKSQSELAASIRQLDTKLKEAKSVEELDTLERQLAIALEQMLRKVRGKVE